MKAEQRSELSRRQWLDPEYRERAVAGMHGATRSEEGCAKMAATARRLWTDPAYREKTLAAMKAELAEYYAGKSCPMTT